MHIPDIIFSAGLDRALGWTVIHAIWQITLVALITGILLIALRGKSAQTRYWVANMALITILLSAVATFGWYFNAAPEQTTTLEPQANATISQPATIALEIIAKGQQVPDAQKTSIELALSDYFTLHFPLIVLIWFTGITIFLLRLLGGLLRVYDLRQRMNFPADPYWTDLLQKLLQKSGLKRSITLLESALVRSPLTIGHLKPLILFPIGVINRLSEQEVEAILAHEVAHILRRDYLFNILQSLIEALFYFHPAIWWLSAQVRNEREHACDDRAIALLGNKITYAKALVVIQEMAYYPQTPALAFAGSRKNQLMKRVQRLFFQPKTSFNIMEKWITTAFVVCIVFVLALGQHLQNNTSGQENFTQSQDETRNSGIWEATFSRDSVSLTLTSHQNGGNWNMGEDFPKTSFTNLTVANGETTFELNRAAGKMSFNGKIENEAGYGRYTFLPDETYRSTLGQEGIKVADDNLLLLCFFADFPADYIKNVRKLGIEHLDKDQLEQLAVFRMTEKSIKSYQELAGTLGKKDIAVDDLIQMKVANVTSDKVKSLVKSGIDNLDLETVSQLSMQNVDPGYIESMNKAGLGKLSGDDLLAAKIQGIDADFVKKAQDLGLGKLDFDQIMNLKIQNVDPEFIKQAQDLGLGKLDFDEIMNLKIQNVDPEFIKQAQNLGFGKLDLDQIMNLKIQNVDPEFIKQAQNLGLGKLDLDQIMNLKIQNIDPEFINKAQNMGFGKLDFDEIMNLKIQNIDADFVQKAQNMGLGKLGLDEIMNLKIQNIDADYIAICKQMNIGELQYDDIVNMKIQGITPEMAKTYRDLGFKNLTVEDLVSAKIQNVTPGFIKETGEKGYKFPTLSEYADLKVRMEMRSSRREN